MSDKAGAVLFVLGIVGLVALIVFLIAVLAWALVTPLAWYFGGAFGYNPALKEAILALFVLAIGAGLG